MLAADPDPCQNLADTDSDGEATVSTATKSLIESMAVEDMSRPPTAFELRMAYSDCALELIQLHLKAQKKFIDAQEQVIVANRNFLYGKTDALPVCLVKKSRGFAKTAEECFQSATILFKAARTLTSKNSAASLQILSEDSARFKDYVDQVIKDGSLPPTSYGTPFRDDQLFGRLLENRHLKAIRPKN